MSHISENSECNASVDSIDFHDSGSRAGTTQEPHEDDNVTLPSKSRYGTSCTGCRRRKQRCDGKVPKCSRCRRLKEKCVYEK